VILDDLISKRVVVLSGKGGTGKSVVGAALALAARDRGKRVLLVEIDASLEAARYLGGTNPGPGAAEVLPGLFTVNLDPAAVMAEYVKHTVKVEALARRVLDSPIYQRFFAAAPGLPELMLLGRILVFEEEREGWPRRPRYDLIVVDAPATGHGLAFLKVPLAASRAVPVGPVGSNARRILELLRDAKRTALVLVAIPEEMAVVEAIEFHRLAVDEVGIRPAAAVLNLCHERRLTQAQEATVLRLLAAGAEGRLARGVRLKPALLAARRHIRRRKLTAFYQNRLKRALPLPLISLPYLFREELGAEALAVLVERLEAAS
jgi:anion-transporting  ArsA/GET3 family ATPase